MDLVATLQKKIKILEPGSYLPGLEAVLMHIETAFRHLSRGQYYSDDTAFTDVIYRTNQAFEGSVKEAYRVLAGKDPSKKSPFEIETYLENNNVFRKRVLGQLTLYRTEWRNPSTHDYKLDFDEDEAFLAIVSVTAFSCLLLDQILERLSFVKAQDAAEEQKVALLKQLENSRSSDLQTRVARLLEQFCSASLPYHRPNSTPTENQVVGALQGFFSSVAPELTLLADSPLNDGNKLRVDLVISSESQKVIVEVKTSRFKGASDQLIQQMSHYLNFSSTKHGIVVVVPDKPQAMNITNHDIGWVGEKIIIIRPESSKN
ncbi:hypothetical protein LJR066_003770 [Acidovorax sp. LjRoot66]|uniref:hypothetical protein n=1 Tax=Acidovorax sp. LjRoot66 TaxID=3342334 RepID=UPI003ECDC99A